MAAAAPFLAAPVILWLLTGLTRTEWMAFGASIAAASLVYCRGARRLASTSLSQRSAAARSS